MRLLKLALLLLGMGAGVLFLHASDILSPISALVLLAFLFAAHVLHSALHEVGHLIGGRISGYTLVFLQIGPFCLSRSKEGKHRLRCGRTRGCQCVMCPREDAPIRYKAYNLGGSLAALLLTAASFALLFADAPYVTLLFIAMLTVGTVSAIGNLWPHKSGGYPNDGYVLRLLARGEAVREDYARYLTLYAALARGETVEKAAFDYERPPAKTPDERIFYDELIALLSELP